MEDILNIIPAPYGKVAAGLFIIMPYITRSLHALKVGGGIRGMWRAIWFGTNMPKEGKKASE